MVTAIVVVNKKSGEIGFRFDHRGVRSWHRYTAVVRDSLNLLVDDNEFLELSKLGKRPAGFEQSLQKAIESWRTMGGLEHYVAEMVKVMQREIDPFLLSWNGYLALGEAEKVAVIRNAQVASLEFVIQCFKEDPYLDWLVIAHDPQSIIDFGEMDRDPTMEELDKLALAEDVPVFVFRRTSTYQ